MLAAAVMPAKPLSQKPGKWSVLNAVNAMTTNIAEHAELDDHHDGVDRGGLAGAADQQQRAHHDQQRRRAG